MWQEYVNAASIDEVLQVLAAYPNRARIIAGGTDLILEIERGVRQGIEVLVDVTRIPGLERIYQDEGGLVHLGPLVTHNHCVVSPIIRNLGLPLALASWEVGAPQIRNRSTVAGNIITASPANDTITPLMALKAQVTLKSQDAERTVPFADFFSGFRQTVMQPEEMLVDIAFPGMGSNERGMFVKLGLRRAQAISVVHVSGLLVFEEGPDSPVVEARLALGAVTPVIVRATEAETYLRGKALDPQVIEEAASLARRAAHPIDDVRGSAAYRNEMVRVCIARGLRAIRDGQESRMLPAEPITLWGPERFYSIPAGNGSAHHLEGQLISAQVNGQVIETAGGQQKTLLRWLREDAGLTGTKEGCAEGECGACTVFLDGAAVMSCLVPAARAHGASIITVEGLANGDSLHPVQRAFIDEGAVQCGYCTPGFLMSAAKLLEERPAPSPEEIRHAITGNLCRCTGYYKILSAMEKAAEFAGS